MPEIVGYCRVSTDGQTLIAQIAELKGAGATKLFAEKPSGGPAEAKEGSSGARRWRHTDRHAP
jgi:DNA invertase Pin-like site-specific DNA recombinase